VTWAADTLLSMHRRCSVLCLGALLASSACERTHQLLEPIGDAGSDGDAGFEDSDGGDAAQTDASDPYRPDGGVFMCGPRVCACSDGQDNEPVPDGLVDGFDPECTGPYDNDEATFATGEKEGNPFCRDCFFDGNSGPEDDDCNVGASCPIDGTFDISNGSCRTCTPTQECVDFCLRVTPNGCDCFGCCEMQDGTQSFSFLLAKSCSMAVLSNEALCPRCEISEDRRCFNPCGECELCVGRTQLPASCSDFDLGYECEGGAGVCDGPNAQCPPDTNWCLQGCCTPLLY
jgi:hypothetical protein